MKSQINILDSAFLTGKLNFKKKKSNDERDAWGGQLGFFLGNSTFNCLFNTNEIKLL